MYKNLFIAVLTLIFPISILANSYNDMAKTLVNKIDIKKYSIAIMPFNYSTDTDSGRTMADEMISAVISAGGSVVERSQIEKIMKEQELQVSGIISDEDASEIGKGVGAKYMILGNATDFTKSGFSNSGIKINARLIDVKTFKVISTASAEVDGDDKVSPYRNKGVKKAAEYPGFIEFFGGPTFFKYSIKKTYPSKETTTYDMNPGFALGLRVIGSGNSFFKIGFELIYNRTSIKNNDKIINSLSTNFPLLLRIPIWTYTSSLPNYTNFYFGIAPGLSFLKIPYFDGIEYKTATAFGFNADFLVGLKYGLSEIASLNFEYRYKIKFLNASIHSEEYGTKNTSVTNRFNGHSLYVGIGLSH